MKVCYPFRNTNGQEFRQQDEVIRLITGEAHGTWLLGTNGLWHGGIHISDISAPFSAFNPDAVNTGDPVPLQFMTDGTLVAYRVNDAYLSAPYCGRPLRYSSTFALVKSVCKPDPDKEATWLEFYSLYMHLAPIADYPLSPCYKVNDGHNNITLRQYIRGEYGVPEGDESATGCAAPHPIARKLKSGDRVVVSRTGRFYVSQRHESVLMTFGLARMVDGNKIGDEQFWVTLDPGLMVPDGEIAELMPEWMHQAREKGTFNEVVVTDGSDCWKVTAGTPLGFLGCMESPGTGAIIAEKEWYAHLEVLSVDPGMQNFLANSQSVTSGKHYVIAQKGKALSIRCGDTGNYTFKEGTAKLGQQVIIARDEANPTQDPSGKWWFNIMGGGWLPQEDISEAGQYDLMKLGFMPLEENTAGDQTDTPFESWVPEVFGQVSRSAEQGHSNQYSLVPQFYRNVLDKMGQDGKISGEEIRQALTIRDPLVRDVVSRVVVKHHSEWFGGRSTGRWDGFYKTLGQLETGYCEKWQADLEWMSKVPPFNQDSAIWHMHPVVFLEALNGSSCACNRDITLKEFQKFIVGVSADTLNSYLIEMNNGFKTFGVTTCREKAHFLAQVLHESGNFRFTKEINGERASYQPWFGRGLIQITLRDNYEKYGQYIGEDVTSGDSARDKLTKLPHSVLSAFWYYNVSRKLEVLAKNDDFNKITATINGGFNGYNDRLAIFISAVKSLGGEHLNQKYNNETFSFETSSIYQSKAYSLAWGLWHDPASNRSGTDKNAKEALKGYKRAKELLVVSPFPTSTPHKKIYNIEYVNVLEYINQRIERLE